MAGATFQEIRAGLAANLTAIKGVQVSAYMLATPTPPTLQVAGPDVITYDLAAQRGLDEWLVLVQGFVGAWMDRASQIMLDKWLAPSGALSVKEALESDPKLGGLVANVRVQESRGYQKFTLDNRSEVLGCEWMVQVLNSGS